MEEKLSPSQLMSGSARVVMNMAIAQIRQDLINERPSISNI
jgi:hypothetical protein